MQIVPGIGMARIRMWRSDGVRKYLSEKNQQKSANKRI